MMLKRSQTEELGDKGFEDNNGETTPTSTTGRQLKNDRFSKLRSSFRGTS